jgi:hypothetical protein
MFVVRDPCTALLITEMLEVLGHVLHKTKQITDTLFPL